MGRATRRDGRRPTPLGSLTRGMAAGMAGTAAMDLLQYLQYRSGGGKDSPLGWEFRSVKEWEGAPAPAQIGKRLYEALFQRELPSSRAGAVNNVMHWGYGLSWAAAFGLAAGSARSRRLRWGPLFGTVVFLSDYVILPPTGLYQPLWEYDAKTILKDWTSHLIYGTVAGATLRGLLGSPAS